MVTTRAAIPSAELRQVCAGWVNDAQQEDFLAWLAEVDAQVRHITSGAMDALDVTNPGWTDLWSQDATVAAAIDHVRAIDFEFEAFWELWKNGEESS